MEQLILVGNSAAAALCHAYLTRDGAYEVVAFAVDQAYIEKETLCDRPVVPFEQVETLYPPTDYRMFVAIFASRVNKTRAEKFEQAKAKGYELISYVSPRASVWPDLVLGDNCLIGDGCICGPGLRIGHDTLLMSGALIGHDSTIGNHCFIAARATLLGATKIGDHSAVGANATILDAVTVGSHCVIGAGSIIHEDAQAGGVYRASPATRLPLSSHRMENILFRRQSRD